MAKVKKNGPSMKMQEGYIKRHPDGFGFFIPDTVDDPDVYIPKKYMGSAMSNDRVLVSVQPEPGGKRFRGEIIKIRKRAASVLTGHYCELNSGTGIILDTSFAWGSDLVVENSNKYPVKDGDWVSVRILSYPDEPDGFIGDITTVIEDVGDPQNDNFRILASSGIPFEFSSNTLKEIERYGDEVTEKDYQGRKDLREKPFITIDGQTAKDFDDAIYVEMNGDGFCLSVAIADVSHYVKPGTALDDDAYERGTSTYFPGFVSPMLPEKLSNHLCSLNPNVPRLAMVAEMQLDFQGNLIGSKFFEAVIKSHARVTYGQAQEIIEKNFIEELKHVEEEILRAADLAKILMAKRNKEGALTLEIPETIVEVDDSGVPIDILQAERLFAHKLIEEMMLMANVAVAKHFTENDVAALFRIHDEPDAEALGNLNAFLQTVGYEKSILGGKAQKKISKALEKFSGHPKQHVMNMLALRSMAQAKYSADNIGHFGLGFSDYSHFTSPIRRYPDLIVHRLLKASNGIVGYKLEKVGDLDSAGTVLSACEQRSVKAERQITAIKKARFMSQFLGQEFEGIISSVAKFGVFVILRQFDVDGLVRIEELGVGLEYDEENMRLISPKTGEELNIGDPLTIIVASTSIDDGRIDFSLAGGEAKKHAPEKKEKSFKKRRKAKNHRGGSGKARVSRSRRKGKSR